MKTIHKILVPIDFSDCAKNAITYAFLVAKRCRASVTMMYVHYVPAMVGEIGIEAKTEEIFEDADIQFEELKAYLNISSDKVIYDFRVELGVVEESIPKVAKQDGYDLIVTGTHGASGVKEVLFGSNSYSIANRADCPVLIVPETKPLRSFKRFVFAGDYNKMGNRKAFDVLIELSQRFNAELHVLHINEDKQIETSETSNAKVLEQYLKPVNHTYHFALNNDVEEGIHAYVDSREIDMVVMFPRKHSFFERVMDKSWTRRLAFHTRAPLLLLK